jgi:hypothetical protein
MPTPSNNLEPFEIRNRIDGHAYDSTCDLVTGQLGRPIQLPSLDLPLAAGGAFVRNRSPMVFRVALPEPCDRFSLYLLRTTGAHLIVKSDFALEPKFGLGCIEESVIDCAAKVSISSADEGGHVVTVQSPVLFTSWAIGGELITNLPGWRPIVVVLFDKHGGSQNNPAPLPVFGPFISIKAP